MSCPHSRAAVDWQGVTDPRPGYRTTTTLCCIECGERFVDNVYVISSSSFQTDREDIGVSIDGSNTPDEIRWIDRLKRYYNIGGR